MPAGTAEDRNRNRITGIIAVVDINEVPIVVGMDLKVSAFSTNRAGNLFGAELVQGMKKEFLVRKLNRIDGTKQGF